MSFERATRNIWRGLLFVAAPCLVVACAEGCAAVVAEVTRAELPPPPPVVQEVEPMPTVVPVAPELDDCARAGARLTELQCRAPTGQPLWVSPRGVPFEEACRAAYADGRDFNARLLACITDCSQLPDAYRGRFVCPTQP